MKIISWNVNGIRAVLNKGLLDFVKKENPDILCLQETKAHPEQVDEILSDYKHYWNSAEKKGYSGTVIFTKKKPLSSELGIGIKEHDTEGRVVTLEFDDFFLVNVYTPNVGRELLRLKYRQGWDIAFRNFLKNLEKRKPVIFCGDLNVAHNEIDLARPKNNVGNAGFTNEEREGFTTLLDSGFIDTFRHFNKEEGHYTWWSYMFSARKKNIGWRIDYFGVSESFISNVKKSEILSEVMGSDHCPVVLEIK